MLHRQRFFSSVFPPLLASSSAVAADSAARQHYLLGIMQLLLHVPQSILVENLKDVLPVTLLALSAEKGELKTAALRTFFVLVQESVDSCAPHMSTVVPLLLSLASFQSSVAARVCAVDSLLALTKLPFHHLYPYLKRVTDGLRAPLDDRKKVVRRHAALCRNEWLVLTK